MTKVIVPDSLLDYNGAELAKTNLLNSITRVDTKDTSPFLNMFDINYYVYLNDGSMLTLSKSIRSYVVHSYYRDDGNLFTRLLDFSYYDILKDFIDRHPELTEDKLVKSATKK